MQQKNRINLLPVDISEKIAAGEVVDRPSSIVKELVENSIDAFADTIVVEIKNGGKTYIRITDSGEGIASPEVEKAFLRHATSKIKKVEDLDAIGTLGFRGEALTSIAAVSKVEMITKTKEEKVGTRLLIEGGHTVETSSVGCPVGTTLVVRDLFYNTPARLKFMKSDASESSRIVDFVSRVALAYPDIRFRMINNGSILFATRGNGSIYENILTIYSKQTGRKLIEINEEKGDHRLFAYISPPDLHRASRRNQVYFVNGRSINSNVLEDAITDAYREQLPSGRFPLAYLFLSVPEDLLDVNIHPNKKEVRFHDNEGVAGFITTSLIKGLQSIEGLPDIKIKPFKYESTAVSDTPNIVESSNSQIVNDQVDIKQILSTKRQEIRELEDTTTRKEHSQAEPTVTIKDKTTPLDDIYPIGSIFA
ncbi:MAG TPA: DNA mismatch repair endonuclease MutL, partial [Anaerovoracaceae bacterium]|nr:DNA mismatch repair endonuclease MutL [Anaerovoracaceae bacterium]